MLKPARVIAAFFLVLLLVALIPASTATSIRGSFISFFQSPLSISEKITQLFKEMVLFRKNAEENRRLKGEMAAFLREQFQTEELALENERLTQILGLRRVFPINEKLIYARVIGRSPVVGERTILIDKGTRDGIKLGMPVLSETCLVGKVAEIRSGAAKVLLLTDLNCRVGAMVQRTRDQGILYGSAAGGCRLKYLPIDSPLKVGDLVQTAGFGRYFPKGIEIGKLIRMWKEPGQIYQVAEIRPKVSLNRLEEVICLESI